MITGLVLGVVSAELAALGALFLLVLVLGLYDGRFLVALSMLLFASQMLNTGVVPDVDLYMAAGACGIALFLGVIRGRLPQFWVLAHGVFPAVLVYLLIGVLTLGGSVDVGRSTTALITSAAAAAFAWILVSAADPDEIRVGIRASMGVILVLSAVYLVIDPDVARVGLASRWRGATDNANTLGVMSALFFLTAKTSAGIRASLLPTIVFVLGAAARTTALGLAIVSGPQLLRGRSRFVRRAVLMLAIVAAIPLLFTVFFTEGSSEVNVADGSLTRLDNSRADSWAAAVDSIKENPLTGIGVGNDRTLWEEELPIHSSVLRPIAEVGLAALVPLGLIVRAGIRSTQRAPNTFRTIFAFMLVLGIFEGWLFAGGSVFYLVFLVAAFLATTAPRDPAEPGAPASPVDPAGARPPAFSTS